VFKLRSSSTVNSQDSFILKQCGVHLNRSLGSVPFSIIAGWLDYFTMLQLSALSQRSHAAFGFVEFDNIVDVS
jgi:hypothetical protein